MEQEADSSDTDGDGEQIYDQHQVGRISRHLATILSWCPQRDKSTGSGLVLAVPAMVLDCQTAIPGAGPQVVTGAEYENLVTDNQYYEQVSSSNIGSRPRHVTRDCAGGVRQARAGGACAPGAGLGQPLLHPPGGLQQRLGLLRHLHHAAHRQLSQGERELVERSRSDISPVDGESCRV